VQIFAEEMAALYPSIDVLINAAGRSYVRPLAMTKMTRAMLPLLWRGSGARWIFNVETLAREDEPDPLFPYASSPPAFRTLSRMFEEELRGSSINVVAVTPRLGVFAAPNLKEHDRLLLERANALEIAQRALAAVCARRPGWKSRIGPQGRRA
jgi:NAD(P)-dependent dehydrogenase (short-subunit alcohol dehydrogenase family)